MSEKTSTEFWEDFVCYCDGDPLVLRSVWFFTRVWDAVAQETSFRGRITTFLFSPSPVL